VSLQAILADLGACTQLGGPLRERTPCFGLGLPEVASLQWDLTCLAATLAVLSCLFELEELPPVAELTERLRDRDDLGCYLAHLLLSHAPCALEEP
jgi:hypothetical protein